MTLRKIEQSAGSLADCSQSDDVRHVANLVMEMAKATRMLAQIIHDHECRRYPELGVQLSDFLDDGTPAKPRMQCEACASHFDGDGQICGDCLDRQRRG